MKPKVFFKYSVPVCRQMLSKYQKCTENYSFIFISSGARSQLKNCRNIVELIVDLLKIANSKIYFLFGKVLFDK